MVRKVLLFIYSKKDDNKDVSAEAGLWFRSSPGTHFFAYECLSPNETRGVRVHPFLPGERNRLREIGFVQESAGEMPSYLSRLRPL